MKRFFASIIFLLPLFCLAQTKLMWQNVDSAYGPLPKGVAIYFTNKKIDTASFRAFYVVADLKNKKLDFTTDTTLRRRLTPSGFYQKNNQPLVVVNGTFFSFATNQNLNVIIKEGNALAFNAPVRGKGQDSGKLYPSYYSAIGITKKRKADVAWIRTDSTNSKVKAVQFPFTRKGNFMTKNVSTGETSVMHNYDPFLRWKMQTAIGGGPVLLQNGEIKITNNEEMKFGGKAINDKHPRTAMGYTADGKLIILVVEGRNQNAGGATLIQLAQILKDLNCVEALNLDGGGSSCLLVNGKETIKPSDKEGQRAVPGVFLISATR